MELSGLVVVAGIHEGEEEEVVHGGLEAAPVFRDTLPVGGGADCVAGGENKLCLIVRSIRGQAFRAERKAVQRPGIRILEQLLQLIHLLFREGNLLTEGRGDKTGAVLQNRKLIGVVIRKGRLGRHVRRGVMVSTLVIEGYLHGLQGQILKDLLRTRIRVIHRRRIGGRRGCHILRPLKLYPVMAAVPVGVAPGIGDDHILLLIVVYLFIDAEFRILHQFREAIFLLCGVLPLIGIGFIPGSILNRFFVNHKNSTRFGLLIPGAFGAIAPGNIRRACRCAGGTFRRRRSRDIHVLMAGSEKQGAENCGTYSKNPFIHSEPPFRRTV